jgi:hypothetical protein
MASAGEIDLYGKWDFYCNFTLLEQPTKYHAETLGISKGASPGEIKKAYHKVSSCRKADVRNLLTNA